MSNTELKESDLADLFATPNRFDDAEIFESRVMRRLQVKLWMRQWLVVLAGFVGGLYALAQFIRMPDLGSGKPVTGTSLQTAAVDTDQTLRAGFEMVDMVRKNLVDLADQSSHYLTFMQTPIFFWGSFALCLMFLGLYYAYSQEETL